MSNLADQNEEQTDQNREELGNKDQMDQEQDGSPVYHDIGSSMMEEEEDELSREEEK